MEKTFFSQSLVLITACCAFYFTGEVWSDENSPVYRLDGITVTGSAGGDAADPAGSVRIIDFAVIRQFAPATIADILELSGEAGFIERGTPGSQADISIRGTSAERVTVMIDGVPLADPQTAHFTMNLPVPLSSIVRIEILPNGTLPGYGVVAAEKAVNIITLGGPDGFHGVFSGGSFGTAGTEAAWGVSSGRTEANASVSAGTSDGYSTGTDFQHGTAFTSGRISRGKDELVWNGGVRAKEYGAMGFYAGYPSFEKTTVYHGALTAVVHTAGGALSFVTAARGHADDFVLDRTEPDFYHNTHFNRTFTLAAQYDVPVTSNTAYHVSTDAVRRGITSPSLGDRANWISAATTGFRFHARHANVNAFVRFEQAGYDTPVILPLLSVRMPLGETDELRASVRRSSRIPSYTERYYVSPANLGDPRLDPQTAWSGELSWRKKSGRNRFTTIVFGDVVHDGIDWTRGYGETIWKATNHGSIRTLGLTAETDVRVSDPLRALVSACFLDQRVSGRSGMVSKYLLNPLETAVSFAAIFTPGNDISGSLAARLEQPASGASRIPVSLSVRHSVSSCIITAACDNLFDESYEELPDLEAHGRWFTVRLEYYR